MSDFGKDKDQELGMSMDDIDRLFDDAELDRMLNDNDVDSLIDSEDFKDLLNADDLDSILNAVHKRAGEEPETKEPPKPLRIPVEEQPQAQQEELQHSVKEPEAEPQLEQEPAEQEPVPAQPQVPPVSNNRPKYQERFRSFTVEIDRSEVEALAQKQAQQRAAIEKEQQEETPVAEQPVAEAAEASAEQPKKQETPKAEIDEVFGIAIPNAKAEHVKKQEIPAGEEEKMEPIETAGSPAETAEKPEEKTSGENLEDLDIDALIREIQSEVSDFDWGGLSFLHDEAQETAERAEEQPAPETSEEPKQEEMPKTARQPVSVVETPEQKKAPAPEKEEEKQEEPVPQNLTQEIPAVQKLVDVPDEAEKGNTFEIEIPKHSIEEIPKNPVTGTFEIQIPDETLAAPAVIEEPAAEEAKKAEPEPQREAEKESAKQEEATSLKIDPAELPSQRTGGKKHRFALLGVVMTLLAVVGVIAVGYFGWGAVSDIFSQKSVKEEFNKITYPLVVVDVPTFESVDKLDSKVVIAAGIWNFMMNEENKDKYQQDDFGTMTVPDTDIEVYIRKLFGTNVEIVHQQLADTDFTVMYDEDKHLYYIPEMPQVLPYAPSVQSVTHSGDDYVVEVGYILPGPFWDITENAQSGEINKTMIYHYQKTKDGDYWIQSVENGNLDLDNTSVPAEETSEESINSEAGTENSSQDTSSETTTSETSSEAKAE
ncbi:Uncharacterised protein [uncultured Ruminococcus sp.]|uniref:Uncharacterized protein n=1 Tax=Massiliimalia timonensis TaxID=1987501 RepID=A0A8J6PC71_9FIRM|nr:hypothetical protein [Massiliimalia timonensis]MBC8609736.1 hypothetical protein [Massiliimalia timonensis]SCH28069.1 Uncharacterised protein [uncultured Ruminococcus sp.]SCH32292.1 Uncharacterised protein [uncultured Clostridium sp.]